MNEQILACDWLEGGLAFSPLGIHVCCVSHHLNKGWPFIAGYAGGEIPTAQIKLMRKQIIQALNRDGYRECEGCPLLSHRKLENSPYLIRRINLSHFTKCNLQCAYCYLQMPKTGRRWWNDAGILAQGKQPTALLPIFRSMIKERLLAPDAIVMWGGGEPALLDEFEELLNYTAQHRLLNEVYTNCTLHSPALQQQLTTGQAAVICSVDAGTAETYRKLKHSGQFDQVWRHLKDYAATGGRVEAKYIFLEDNSDQRNLAEFIQHVQHAGIQTIRCDVDAFDPHPAVADHIRQAIESVRVEAQRHNINVIIDGSGIIGFPEREVIMVKECSICGYIGDFQIQAGFSLREAICPVCKGSRRTRDLVNVILRKVLKQDGLTLKAALPQLKQLSIFEAQASGPLHDYLQGLPGYVCSEYIDLLPPGQVSDAGIRCEDLEKLTFPDNYFDLVITQDIFEHLKHPEKAFQEIHRVLKPDGFHIFTVPIHEGRKTTRRVGCEGGKELFLLPPVYHYDPLRPSGSLVYTDFGDDLADSLKSIGFSTEILVEGRFYPNDQIPLVSEGPVYDAYLQSRKQDDLLKFFLYNSIVCASQKTATVAAGRLSSTGERYIPWDSDPYTHYEHLHRYRFAKEFVIGKKVLDLGCGEGYGSSLLAEAAQQVIGVDIDQQCIRHASSKYLKPNIKFIRGSMTRIPLADETGFDVIVCFEALEHIAEHDLLLAEVKRLLHPDGLLIVSTPNKQAYSDERHFDNPFHVKELYLDEFEALLSSAFQHVFLYGEQIYPASRLFPLFTHQGGEREYTMTKAEREFVFLPSSSPKASYFIGIAADRRLQADDLPGTSYLTDISNALLTQHDVHLERLKLQAVENERVISEQSGVIQAKAELIEAQQRQLEVNEAVIQQLIRERDLIKHSKAWRLAERLRRLVYEKRFFA